METLTPQVVRQRALGALVTMKQVLERASVRESTFWRWEGGHQQPRPLTLAKIEAALKYFEK